MPDYKIRIVVEGEDKASGPLGAVGGSLQRIGEFAAGGLLARGIEKTISGATSATKALVGMVVEGGNFEAQVDGINALLGGTEQSAAKIADLITDLGIDPKLKVTSQEAADSIEMLVRNGMDLETIAGGAARGTVLLANATGADFATAADLATDAMAIFGMQADEMGQVVDNITGVVTGSKFDVHDYALALAQGGSAAAVAGLNMEEFSAAIGAIAPNFDSGSDAGTSFKTMMQRLIPETNDQADMMRKLGLFTGLTDKEFEKVQDNIGKTQQKIADLDPESKNYEENLAKLQSQLKGFQGQLVAGNSAFFDQNGNMEDAATIAGSLHRALDGLSDQERLTALSTIFGTDAMRAAAGMSQYTAEEFQKLQDAFLSGDAEKIAAALMDNLAGDLEVFGGIFETVKNQISDEFQPAARSAIQTFTKLFAAAAPGLIAFAENVSAWLEPYATALSAWADNAVAEFQRVNELAGGGINGFVAGVGAATGAEVTVGATVTTVDWGEFSYTYDSESGVREVEWGNWTHIYDAAAGISTVDWHTESHGFTYFAEAGITTVDWNDDDRGVTGGFTYSAEAGITSFDYHEEYFDYVYTAEAGVEEVRFGNFSYTYDSDAAVKTVQWGIFTYTYDVIGKISSFQIDRDAISDWASKVSESLEGQSPTLNLGSALREAWDEWRSDDKTVEVGVVVNEEPEWGTWEHQYAVGAGVDASSVLWGAWTHVYGAGAEVGSGDVSWGDWVGAYKARANIFKVEWGNWTHVYDVWGRIKGSFGGGGDDGGDTAGDTSTDGGAVGITNWRGGMVQVHRDEVIGLRDGSRIFTKAEAGQMAAAGVTNNVSITVGSLANDMDIDMLAYRILDKIKMRG